MAPKYRATSLPDGLQLNEPGIPGVEVKLYRQIAQTTQWDFVLKTTTDGIGRYRFEHLLPGAYRVDFITPAGLAPTQRHVGNDRKVDSDASSQFVPLVDVDITDIDGGFVLTASPAESPFVDTLQFQQEVDSTYQNSSVFYERSKVRLVGRVMDHATNSPAPFTSVTVKVDLNFNGEYFGHEFFDVLSDANGNFALENLPNYDDGPWPGNGTPSDRIIAEALPQIYVGNSPEQGKTETSATVKNADPMIDDDNIQWSTYAVDENPAVDNTGTFDRKHYLRIEVPFTDLGLFDKHKGFLESAMNISPENIQTNITTTGSGHVLVIEAMFWKQQFVNKRSTNGQLHEKRKELFPFEVKVEDDDTGSDTATIATDHGCVSAGEPTVHEGPLVMGGNNGNEPSYTLTWRFPVEDPGACSLVNFKQGYIYRIGKKQSTGQDFAEYGTTNQYGQDVSTDFFKERTIDSTDNISAWSEHHTKRVFDQASGKYFILATDTVKAYRPEGNISVIHIDFTMVLFDVDRAQQTIEVIYRNGNDFVVPPGNVFDYWRIHPETPSLRVYNNTTQKYATTPDDDVFAENLTPEDGIGVLKSHNLKHKVDAQGLEIIEP
jgi:SdrD B-like domain